MIYDYSTEELKAGPYDGLHKEPFRQPTWYKYVDKDRFGVPLRGRFGLRKIKG